MKNKTNKGQTIFELDFRKLGVYSVDIDSLVNALEGRGIKTLKVQLCLFDPKISCKKGYFREVIIDANNIKAELKNLESKYDGRIISQIQYMYIDTAEKKVYISIIMAECKNIDYTEEELELIKKYGRETV